MNGLTLPGQFVERQDTKRSARSWTWKNIPKVSPGLSRIGCQLPTRVRLGRFLPFPRVVGLERHTTDRLRVPGFLGRRAVWEEPLFADRAS
jgi:hypothetical protein